MKLRRIAATVLVGVVFIGLFTPIVIQYRSKVITMSTITVVFKDSQDGNYKTAESKGLITDSAVQALRAGGNGTAAFRLRLVSSVVCQASGAPCIARVELAQKQRIYGFRLYVYWGTITFAVPEPANDSK